MGYPRNYRLAAAQILSADSCRRILLRYDEIALHAEWTENPRLRKHLFGHILPGLAIYQVLSAECGRQGALERLDRILEITASMARRRMLLLGRCPWAYTLLRWAIQPAMRAYPADGWETEWVEISSKAIRFNIHRCFYHEMFSCYKASELTASFCRVDDLIYEGVSPYFHWDRSQTIGKGAAFCNFGFSRAFSI